MFYALLGILAYILEIALGKKYLKWITSKNYVQPLLEEGPDHQSKQGTPTMGGISFILTIVVLTIVSFILLQLFNISNNMLPLISIVLIAYAYIGFKDDILKVTKKDNAQGLSPKQKIIAQFVVALITVIYLFMTKYDMQFSIYIFDKTFALSNLIQIILYSAFVIFLFVGVSNATNLTDGLDGLLTSLYIISFIGIWIIAYDKGNVQMVTFIYIVIVTLISFLNFNRYPAKMFMGDTGSLALGGLLVIVSIILHIELMIFFFGFVFLIETISVIFQVTYFKITKRKFGEGRRLFKMAPFHHHLEKEGYSEKKIVSTLCFIQVIASTIGLLVYFL